MKDLSEGVKILGGWALAAALAAGIFLGMHWQERACLREMALDHGQYRWEIITERWTYGSRSYKCWNYVSDATTWELYDRGGKLMRTLSQGGGIEIIYARELR